MTVKSQPDPVRGTARGLPLALSVIVSVPVRDPITVGVNVTLMAQVAPAATLAPQVFVWAKSPVTTMEVIARAVLPLFVRVTLCAALVVVRNCPPKARFAGASPTTGTKVSFATNASEGPFRVVWNAPGLGNTGRFVEKVVPVK